MGSEMCIRDSQEGDKFGRAVIKFMLADRRTSGCAIDAAIELAGSLDVEVADAVRAAARRLRRRKRSRSLRRLADAGKELVAPPPPPRGDLRALDSWMKWRGLEPRIFAEAAVSIGLTTQVTADNAIEAMHKEDPSDERTAPGAQRWLEVAGLLKELSQDCLFEPGPHDVTLRELAAASNGELQPECVWQSEEPHLKLHYVNAGIAYEVELRNFGCVLDIDRVVASANRALGDAGSLKRFCAYQYCPGTWWFAFCEEGRLEAAASAIGFELLEEVSGLSIDYDWTKESTTDLER